MTVWLVKLRNITSWWCHFTLLMSPGLNVEIAWDLTINLKARSCSSWGLFSNLPSICSKSDDGRHALSQCYQENLGYTLNPHHGLISLDKTKGHSKWLLGHVSCSASFSHHIQPPATSRWGYHCLMFFKPCNKLPKPSPLFSNLALGSTLVKVFKTVAEYHHKHRKRLR